MLVNTSRTNTSGTVEQHTSTIDELQGVILEHRLLSILIELVVVVVEKATYSIFLLLLAWLGGLTLSNVGWIYIS